MSGIVEAVTDALGTVTHYERWACDVPPPGAKFQVIRDEWSSDYSVRTIHEVRLVVSARTHDQGRVKAK